MNLRLKFQDLYIELWPWFDPSSRLYFVNLLITLVLALGFVIAVQKKMTLKEICNFQFLKLHFKTYWLHPSALVDYQIFGLNAFLKVVFFSPVLGLSLIISMYVIKGLYLLSPDFSPWAGSFWIYLFATLFAFVWDDFLRFFHHWMMHKFEWMWQLHKTHHSAEVLTPLTLFRTHPLESLQASFRNALSFGVSGGVFMFLFSGQFELITLLEVNIFGFLFNTFTGNLRHSQIPMSLGPLEHILISPKQHQIHHSNLPEHFNKNFGVALSIWDKVFGTFLKSDQEIIKGYGVQGLDGQSFKAQLLPWTVQENAKSDLNLMSWVHRKNILHRLFLLVVFLALNTSPYRVLASKDECVQYLVFGALDNIYDPDANRVFTFSEYFVPGRIVTLPAMNVSLNFRSDLAGDFRATLSQPRRFRLETIPAQFARPSIEAKFKNLRHPILAEIYDLWLSGHLEKFENFEGEADLILVITHMWRKDPRLIFNPDNDKIVSLK